MSAAQQNITSAELAASPASSPLSGVYSSERSSSIRSPKPA